MPGWTHCGFERRLTIGPGLARHDGLRAAGDVGGDRRPAGHNGLEASKIPVPMDVPPPSGPRLEAGRSDNLGGTPPLEASVL
jgi:hypothetical protein